MTGHADLRKAGFFGGPTNEFHLHGEEGTGDTFHSCFATVKAQRKDRLQSDCGRWPVAWSVVVDTGF